MLKCVEHWWQQSLFFSRHLWLVAPTCSARCSYWWLASLLLALHLHLCSSFPYSPLPHFLQKSKASFCLSSGSYLIYWSIVLNDSSGENFSGAYQVPSAQLPFFPSFACGWSASRRPRSSKGTTPGQPFPLHWVGSLPFSITGPYTLSSSSGLNGSALTGRLVVFLCSTPTSQISAFSLPFYLAVSSYWLLPKPSEKQGMPGGRSQLHRIREQLTTRSQLALSGWCWPGLSPSSYFLSYSQQTSSSLLALLWPSEPSICPLRALLLLSFGDGRRSSQSARFDCFKLKPHDY